MNKYLVKIDKKGITWDAKLLNIGQLSFWVFFLLMLVAKAVGLDSGRKLYLILSAVSILFIAVKLLLTDYSFRELAVAIALLLLSGVAYYNSGRMGIVLSMLAIVGMKGLKARDLLKKGMVVYGVFLVGTVVLAMLSIIPNPYIVHEKGALGEAIRYGMGFSTANVFHESLFVLMVLIVVSKFDSFNIKRAILMMLANILAVIYTLSYTGFLVSTLFIALSLYIKYRRQLSILEKFLIWLITPVCIAFSLIAPYFVNTSIGNVLDRALQARLSFSYFFMSHYQIPILGQRMKEVPLSWIIIDNGFVYILMTFGLIIFILFSGGYLWTTATYLRKNVYKERVVAMSAMMVYGITEQFINNSFMNVTLFFVGEMLWLLLADERIEELALYDAIDSKNVSRIRTEKKYSLYIVSAFAFLIGVLISSVFGRKIETVIIPLKYLPKVAVTEATIEMNSLNLNDILFEDKQADNGQLMIDKEALIAYENEMKDNIAAEVRDGFELYIPQSTLQGKTPGIARLRLYHLDESQYYNYEKELADITNDLDIKEGYVYKNEGNDRTEHIRNKDELSVTKIGMLVRMENVRRLLNAGLLSGLFTGLLYSLFLLKRNQRK